MNFLRFEFVLENLEPLHVGTGDSRAGPEAHGPSVSECVLNSDGFPWIPGSTLKGCLRSLCSGDQEALFGTAHGDSGNKGRLVCHGAHAKEAVNLLTLQQTALHRGTGASDPNKLFQRHWVPEGTHFHCELELDLDRDVDGKDQCVEQVAELFGHFASTLGVPIGRNKSDGHGAMRLSGAVSVTSFSLTAKGWHEEKLPDVNLKPAEEKQTLVDMVMECRGPYHSFGYVSEENGRQSTRTKRRGSGILSIPNSGIAGALRTRAEWLMALDSKGSFDSRRQVHTTAGRKTLNVVERLFGAEGYRGSLDIRGSVEDEGDTTYVTSVAIDRFAASPMQIAPFTGKALGPFTVEAQVGVELRLRIEAFRNLDEDAKRFFDFLVKDIQRNGLQLGKGSARGFGWFACADAPEIEVSDVAPPQKNAPSNRHDAIRKIVAQLRALNRAEPEIRAILSGKGVNEAEIDAALSDAASAPPEFRAPSSDVTLPYRHIHYDPSRHGMPEASVLAAWEDRNLHSNPLPQGLSGMLDVTWTFTRPMAVLDNSKSCMKMNGHYVLPGATVRGNLRSILEAVTSARMTRVNWPTKADQKRKWARKPNYYAALESARAAGAQSNFSPDFVQALFGYVNGEDLEETQGQHDMHHLKSRLAFDVVWGPALDDVRPERRSFYAAEVNPASKIYSHIGWKRYPVDNDPDHMRMMMEGGPRGNANMETHFERLPASPQDPLVFRGRIAVHNVTKAELGALLWALTWDGAPHRRHKIGYCKPFGMGVCSVTGLTMQLRLREGQPMTVGLSGIEPYVAAFREYLASQDLFDTQAYTEMLASATPGVLQRQSAYQVWTNGLQQVAEGPEIQDEQDGRVTAMLKPVTPP